MPRKFDRVIIDTNIWISFLLTKGNSNLDKLLFNDSIRLLWSTELMEEFIEVSGRPKFRKYFIPEDLLQILNYIEKNTEMINVVSVVHECRDEKDNFLLSLAKDGKADFLISGDLDLISLKKFEKTEILTIADFVKRI